MVLAQAIYVMVGFGSGLIALGCLALTSLNLTDLVVTLLLVSLPSEGFVVARSWREITWPETARICAGVAIGALIGTFFLATGAPTLMLKILSVLLVVSGAGFLWSSLGSRVVSWPIWMQLPVGVASGVLSGLLGAGGPPLIVYYRLAGVSKATFRGNLMAVFLATTVVRLAATGAGGLLTVPRVASAALLLPAALVGLLLGRSWHSGVSEATFRTIVSSSLMVIGVALLLR